MPQLGRVRNPPVDSKLELGKMLAMNGKLEQKAARKAKLAKALKANVKRRKQAIVVQDKQSKTAAKE